MKRQILLLMILISGLPIYWAIQGYQTKQSVALTQAPHSKLSGSAKMQNKVKENIRFNFTAVRIDTINETVEIKASLSNDNADTVYFLSTSCDGEQYSLRYDTTKFVLTPHILCNQSIPQLIKIAPKGKHNFKAHFRCGNKVTKIKLGFDLYSVDQSFVKTNKNLGNINIFNRPNDEQTILWADEKTVE
jgi:hypothetical protein